MKLRVLSDIHLEFRPVDIVATDGESDSVLVLAGDIIPSRNLALWSDWFEDLSDRFKAVIYVAGNHEHYHNLLNDSFKTLREECLKTGAIFLENDVAEIDGVKIAGCTLWSNVQGKEYLVQSSMNDYRLIYGTDGPLWPEDTYTFHKDSLKFLEREEYDIVVTHHAPSFQSCGEYRAEMLSVAYATELGWLVESKKPKLWIHGHTHSLNDYMMYDTRVVSNCLGYPGEILNFKGLLEVEV